eukprot:m.56232 g.56232  ORF g.56232 m.56232 type:complete len:433 (-) comp15574_c0_seq2:595-1893(-)
MVSSRLGNPVSSIRWINSPSVVLPTSLRRSESKCTNTSLLCSTCGFRALPFPKKIHRDVHSWTTKYADHEDIKRRGRLTWGQAPTNILLVKKPHDRRIAEVFADIGRFLLMYRPDIIVHVQHAIPDSEISPMIEEAADRIHMRDESSDYCQGRIRRFDDSCRIDLVVTLGGDGTLLYAASKFQRAVPPIMSFAMGRLGFLTPFKIASFAESLDHVLAGRYFFRLRSRLACEVVHEPCPRGTDDAPNPTHGTATNADGQSAHAKDGDGGPPACAYHCLNEVLIDRGQSPMLSDLVISCNDKPITTVAGDGIIFATPTGSTAYSLAAGGPIVHPTVACTTITPICPHSLSFRPIVVPAAAKLTVCVPATSDARQGVMVSMDGRNRQPLLPGDQIVLRESPWPVPTVVDKGQDSWFEDLSRGLNWANPNVATAAR